MKNLFGSNGDDSLVDIDEYDDGDDNLMDIDECHDDDKLMD